MHNITRITQRLDLDRPVRVLSIWAHPDDEAYLAAGLMAEVVDGGGTVTVMTLTDGEAGFGVDDPRSDTERAAARRAELASAMAEIGVDDVRSLHLPDGSLEDRPSASVVGPIIQAMLDVRPDVVVTFGPDGLTGHPDHVATWRFVTRAWAAMGMGELWYSVKTTEWLDTWRDLHDEFGVWMTDEPTGVEATSVDHVVDVRGAELDRKRAVLAGHASQTAGISAAVGEDRYRRWIAQEAFRRAEDGHLAAAAVPTAADLAEWCSRPRRERV